MMQLCLPVAAMLVALSGRSPSYCCRKAIRGVIGLLFPVIAFAVLCANLTSFVYGVVIYAHKRPWLLIVATFAGVGCDDRAVGGADSAPGRTRAALALAGGSVIALVACVLISERLTPVPVPWRDIALSLATSIATARPPTLPRPRFAARRSGSPDRGRLGGSCDVPADDMAVSSRRGAAIPHHRASPHRRLARIAKRMEPRLHAP